QGRQTAGRCRSLHTVLSSRSERLLGMNCDLALARFGHELILLPRCVSWAWSGWGERHTYGKAPHADAVRHHAVCFLLAHPASERAPARVVPGQPGRPDLDTYHAE